MSMPDISDDGAQQTVVNEIATLLDQCSPEELANILQAIEGGEDVDLEQVLNQQLQQQAPPSPVPPAGPPPSSGNGRRPAPAGYKRGGSGEGEGDDAVVSMGEMKKLLEEHSQGVLNEVRKMVSAPSSPPFPALPSTAPSIDPSTIEAGLQSGSLNLDVLTQILSHRDQEVKGLETQLAELQEQLMTKDRRIMDLNGELDCSIREVRHRQLDLEFQQLKLEERVRSNNELEQAYRSLTQRVEEANRDTRHAALDVDLARSLPPRSARVQCVQGSLPWMLRKNRPWGTSDAWASP
jgi:hypothetical protein